MRILRTFIIDKLTEVQAKEGAAWVPAEEDRTGFQTLARMLLSEYLDVIKKERASAAHMEEYLVSKAEGIKEQIRTLSSPAFLDNTKAVKDTLARDVHTNSGILEKLLKERKEYLEYLKNSTREAAEMHTASNRILSKEHLLDDLGHVVTLLFQNYIEVTAETIRRFEAQKGALIKIDEMTPQEAAVRLEGKIELLKKELSCVEKEIAAHQEEISLINTTVEKVEEAIAEVSDPGKATKKY